MTTWKTRVSCIALMAGIATATIPAALAADDQAYSLNITAQPLGQALRAFADQTDLQILYSHDLVKQMKSGGVSGSYLPEQALHMLLGNTGLAVRRTDDNTFVVHEGDKYSATLGTDSAADNSADEDVSFVLEEIIVTATRRQASMKDIPISIAAFSGERLKDSGIDTIEDLPFLAAGLTVGSLDGELKLTIRGISNNFIEDGVAFHRDGVYIDERADRGMSFFDVDRIEVLRGPQGTLYGRNATGGTLNVITKSPTDEFETGGFASFGNYNRVEAEGYVSGPLIGDKLLARVAVKTLQHDGFTPNLFNGDALDDADFTGIRGKILYTLADNVTLNISADYGQDDNRAVIISRRGHLGTPTPTEINGAPFPTGRVVSLNGTTDRGAKAWGVSATLDWDFTDLTLSSTTAYREFHYFNNFDGDGGDGAVLQNLSTRDSEQFSQELILASAGEADLNWVLGGFYFHGDDVTYNPVSLFLLNTIFIGAHDRGTDAYGIFGEASYKLMEKLTLTLGARYSYEKRSFDGTSTIFGSTSVIGPFRNSWGSFTPKVAITYEASDDISAYLTVGKGFKSGGFSADTFNGQGFNPEKITNYEAGVKTTLLDNKLQANISVFYMDYKDLQLNTLVIGPGGVSTFPITNAAEATVKGLEADFQANISANFSIDGNVAYLDASFDRYENVPHFGLLVEATGNTLPEAPKWSTNIGANYTMPVGDWGNATLRGEYSYRGKMFYDAFENDLASQDGFSMVNASLTFEESDGKWRISLWGKNLGDVLASSMRTEFLSGLTGSRLASSYFPPRTYGITVGYEF